MDKEKKFNDALISIIEYASSKGNQLTSKEIRAQFSDFINDENQYEFICQYLTSNNIYIDGLEHNHQQISADSDEKNISETKTDNEITRETEQELSFIKMYMNDLASVPPADNDEKMKMIDALRNGDQTVLNRLIELHLQTVAEIAERYRGRGVSYGDLIQEGNMGLITALSEFDPTTEDFDSFIEDSIISALENAINIEVNADRIGSRLANKLNQLDNATKRLSEQLGRVPEISELAKEMNLSEDEVSWLLKISLDTLSVGEDTDITPSSDENTAEVKTDIQSSNDPLTWRINKK